MADVDLLPTFAVDMEGELHDVSRLPHMHTPEEIKKYFPTIKAAPLQPNAEDWVPENEEKCSGLGHGGAQHRSELVGQGRARQQAEQARPRTRQHDGA